MEMLSLLHVTDCTWKSAFLLPGDIKKLNPEMSVELVSHWTAGKPQLSKKYTILILDGGKTSALDKLGL